MSTTTFSLKKLVDKIPGALFQFEICLNGTTKFVFASKGFDVIFDLPSDEFKEDASLALSRVHPEDYISLMRHLKKSQNDKDVFNHTLRVITSVSKRIIWLKITAIPEYKDQGCTTWNGYMSDITKEMNTASLN